MKIQIEAVPVYDAIQEVFTLIQARREEGDDTLPHLPEDPSEWEEEIQMALEEEHTYGDAAYTILEGCHIMYLLSTHFSIEQEMLEELDPDGALLLHKHIYFYLEG